MESDAYTEVRKLLDQIRLLTNNPSIERVSNQIEVLCKGYMEMPPDSSIPLSLREIRGKQGDLLKLLLSRQGHVVTRDAIMNALYFDSHDEPEYKIADVFAHHLRKQLIGTPYKIESVWGVGYKLLKDHDFIPLKDRTACRYGHPYDAENTYIAKDGKRKCKACRAASRARYNLAHAA